jgi:hypothetical protein
MFLPHLVGHVPEGVFAEWRPRPPSSPAKVFLEGLGGAERVKRRTEASHLASYCPCDGTKTCLEVNDTVCSADMKE